MNVKKANEILIENKRFKCMHYDDGVAAGFLEAIEQTKPLVEFAEWIKKGEWTGSGDRQGATWMELEICNKASMALSAYKKTVMEE